ncbi:DUF3718 domain-containing protein [Alteromonas sp. ASW11-36]|uniref:DUF3718 domain-containing protein n=1 Tax=Alteromonas arenosi TaxID=3055817 RepID=A0ABT7T0F4_9ALTE|nr:DUF3718 domain-containing protein [Alteromonas sp. ASW11-36]MDM7861928.1 DUF3718 domain-containing protein [Alteromonas sp. ASW11-36]
MKAATQRVCLILTTAAAIALAPLSATAGNFDPALEKDLVRICAALKSDSRLALHRAVKRSRLSYKQIDEGLMCNGESAQDFARTHNANLTASTLAAKARSNNGVLTARRSGE